MGPQSELREKTRTIVRDGGQSSHWSEEKEHMDLCFRPSYLFFLVVHLSAYPRTTTPRPRGDPRIMSDLRADQNTHSTAGRISVGETEPAKVGWQRQGSLDAEMSWANSTARSCDSTASPWWFGRFDMGRPEGLQPSWSRQNYHMVADGGEGMHRADLAGVSGVCSR